MNMLCQELLSFMSFVLMALNQVHAIHPDQLPFANGNIESVSEEDLVCCTNVYYVGDLKCSGDVGNGPMILSYPLGKTPGAPCIDMKTYSEDNYYYDETTDSVRATFYGTNDCSGESKEYILKVGDCNHWEEGGNVAINVISCNDGKCEIPDEMKKNLLRGISRSFE